MKEVDRRKTTISVGPFGFYECDRAAFVPATFQKHVECCLGKINPRECLG